MPYDTYRRSLSRALAALLPEGAEISDSVLLKAFATFSMIKARSPSDMAADYQKIVSGAGLDAVTDYVALRGLSADGRLFAEAHELFTGLSHDRFLRFAVPDFACNPVAAIYIIERYTPGTRDTVFHILAVKHVADIAQNGPAPRKRELKAQLWSIYTSEFPSNGTTLKRDDFLELYQAINYYPLSVQESSINNTAMKAVTAWKNIGEPVERQLEYAALFYLENQQPGELEQRYLAAGEDGGSEKRRAVFTDALKILGRVYPVDFLCAAVFNEKYNDIALENGLVYTQFTSGLFPESEGCRVLIYSPTPFFIRKWLLDPALRTVDTTFLVEDTSSRDLLRYNYQSKEYGTGVNNNVTFEVKDKWEKRIREEGRLDCSLILYFATHSPAGQQDESIRLWKRYADKELAFCLLAGTGELEDASSPLSRELYDTRIKIDAICLLPQGINRSTIPRRKLLIRCTMEPRDAVSGGTAADGDYITEL
ncbi:MAG: hypothetical protein GXY05_11650, partial [Clostridiales bacterium]|nr:hypothetical protein [Clostridiales bacterium]